MKVWTKKGCVLLPEMRLDYILGTLILNRFIQILHYQRKTKTDGNSFQERLVNICQGVYYKWKSPETKFKI